MIDDFDHLDQMTHPTPCARCGQWFELESLIAPPEGLETMLICDGCYQDEYVNTKENGDT